MTQSHCTRHCIEQGHAESGILVAHAARSRMDPADSTCCGVSAVQRVRRIAPPGFDPRSHTRCVVMQLQALGWYGSRSVQCSCFDSSDGAQQAATEASRSMCIGEPKVSFIESKD